MEIFITLAAIDRAHGQAFRSGIYFVVPTFLRHLSVISCANISDWSKYILDLIAGKGGGLNH